MRPLLIVAVVAGAAALTVQQAASDITATSQNLPQPAAGAAGPSQSQIRVAISVPFAKLSELLSEFEFKFHGQGTSGLLSYDGVVTINKVSVAKSPNPQHPLRLNAPFHATGKIGQFPINQTGDASVDLAITIGNAWCPLVEIGDPLVTLSQPAPLPAGFGAASISEFVASNLLGHELKQQLTCETVKGLLQNVWRIVSLPVSVATNTMYIGITPQAISVSDVSVANDRVIITVIVTSVMTLRTTPLPEPLISLPNPKKISLPEPPKGNDYEGSISGSFSPGNRQ
jgi:hypothetical protein